MECELAASGGRYHVKSLERGLALLRCFRPGSGPLTIAQIARQAGMPRQSANRLVRSLVQLGCLAPHPSAGRYQMGSRMVGLGRAVLSQLPIAEIVQPIMQRLADEHQTSVGLGVGHQLDMIYIQYCASVKAVSFRLRVGSTIPMATTAMGRAYLWGLDPDARGEALRWVRWEAGEDADAIVRLIAGSFEEIDSLGFCATLPSSRGDISGVGAPLVLNGGDTVMALNCGMARLGLDEEAFRRRCGPALVKVVAEIKDVLGNVDPEYLGIPRLPGPAAFGSVTMGFPPAPEGH